MVAALATLDVIDRQDLMTDASVLGSQIGEALQALQPRFEFLKEIRWRGLMIGIEFGRPQSFGLSMAWALMNRLDKSLFPQAAIIPLLDKHHILTQVAGHHLDVIKLLPPLIISGEDIMWFVTAFEEVLSEMHSFPGGVWDSLSEIGWKAIKAHLPS
jgi:ornithine--oxo-acid transaminase